MTSIFNTIHFSPRLFLVSGRIDPENSVCCFVLCCVVLHYVALRCVVCVCHLHAVFQLKAVKRRDNKGLLHVTAQFVFSV